MEHTLAYLHDDIDRERRRSDFLWQAVLNYAPHAANDIQRELASNYPRARHRVEEDD